MAQERFDLEQIQASEQERVARPGYPPAYGYPEGNPYGYGYGYEEDDEKVYVRRMWRAIRKRKWMIAVLAIITTSIVTVEMFRTKSIYQASATVEIGKENRTLVKSGDVVIQADESDDMYYVSTAMKTKVRQLASRPLLEEVVAAARLDENPRFLEVNGKKTIWEALKVMGSKVHGGDSYDPQRVSVNPTLSPGAESGERSEEESARLAPYVDVLEANLTADPLPDTRMLVVSFAHTDPVVAATVANAVSRVFINYSFENKTEKYRDASEWLTRSTRELEAKVQEAEQELATYSRANNIFSTDGKETLTGEKLSRLHDQATRAETDRILKESLYQEVKAGRVAQLPEAFSDPKISALQAKLGELTVQASELDVKYGPKNQRVVEVKQQIAAIQAQIEDSRKSLEGKLQADYERSVRDEASLKGALERAKGEAVQQNQATIQLNILQQKVATAKDLYTQFLQKTSQAKIESAEQHNNLRLVDPARVPGAPISPNRLRTIMIGLLVSLLTGAVLALLLEYLDNTVKSVEDVARYAQLPALSVIPSIRGSKSPLLISTANGMNKSTAELALTPDESWEGSGLAPLGRGSAVAEAYRVLRTSVLLSTAGNPPKTILITSAQPGEGKTTTAINTATSLAQLGGSVLLIDCDLRKPSVHKALGLDRSEGLSTYLSRKVNVEDLIKPLPVANLSVLQSGPVPPNAAELISSAQMKELLKTLGEKYDHIVIDSPPLINVTDPVILSTMVDGVVLVVQGGKSTREVVRRARMELATANAKVFGVVLNNVNLKREGYNDYYYDRYYSSYGEGRAESSGD
jgi:capsular exopolysaccharide synthesis family protein